LPVSTLPALQQARNAHCQPAPAVVCCLINKGKTTMFRPLGTMLALSAVFVAQEARAASPTAAVCEVHVWATGENFSTEWSMSSYGGGSGDGVGSLTTTIQALMERSLTAQDQVNAFKSANPEKLLPADRFTLHYEGYLSLTRLAAMLKSRTVSAPDPEAPCFADLVFGGNNFQDMMMGRRRLYSMIHFLVSKNGKFSKKSKQMIDPLNKIDDMYYVDDLNGMVNEIRQSFANNAIEFTAETKAWLAKK
jgi:hypothetical protein